MRGLPGRSIVIAGGASGIGAATAVRLAGEGARVVVGDIDVAGARATAESIAATGCDAVAFDLAGEASVERLIQSAVDRAGRLDGGGSLRD